MAGASTATVNPAMVNARPSQLAGDAPPGIPSPTDSVRYTENTNVTTIALRPTNPQSHSAQAATRDFVTAGGCVMVGTLRVRADRAAGSLVP